MDLFKIFYRVIKTPLFLPLSFFVLSSQMYLRNKSYVYIIFILFTFFCFIFKNFFGCLCFLILITRLFSIQLPESKGREQSLFLSGSVIRVKQKEQLCQLDLKTKEGVYRLKINQENIGLGDKLELQAQVYPIEVKKNPGDFNTYGYFLAQGLRGSGKIIRIESQLRCRDARHYLEVFRKYLDDKMKGYFTTQEYALFQGMVLGEDQELDLDTKDRFKLLGLSHALVASGSNVSIAFGLFFLGLTQLGFSIKKRYVVGLGILLVLGFFTHWDVSISRAILMSGYFFLGRCCNRSVDWVHALFVSSFILFLRHPSYVYHLGFWMSFSITLCLLLFNRLCDYSGRILRRGRALITILVAQLPLYVFYIVFNSRLNVLFFVFNLVLEPVFVFIILCGFALYFLAILPLGFIVYPCVFALKILINLLWLLVNYRGINRLPNIIFTFEKWFFYPAYIFLVLVFIFIFLKDAKKFKSAVLCFVLSFGIGLGFYTVKRARDPELTLCFMDVGQGDGCLVWLKNGPSFIIDAGRIENGRRIDRVLNYYGIDRVDYGVVTHKDVDHYGGFNYLTQVNRIKKLILNSTRNLDKIAVLLSNQEQFTKDVPPFDLFTAGQRYVLAEDIFLDVIHPSEDFYDENENESGIGLLLHVFGQKILFMADIGIETELKILDKFEPVDILKVGHHGSKYSTSKEFIYTINPRYGIIGVGEKNRYGHPTQRVLELLSNNQTIVYRTDKHGACIFRFWKNKTSEYTYVKEDR